MQKLGCDALHSSLRCLQTWGQILQFFEAAEGMRACTQRYSLSGSETHFTPALRTCRAACTQFRGPTTEVRRRSGDAARGQRRTSIIDISHMSLAYSHGHSSWRTNGIDRTRAGVPLNVSFVKPFAVVNAKPIVASFEAIRRTFPPPHPPPRRPRV